LSPKAGAPDIETGDLPRVNLARHSLAAK